MVKTEIKVVSYEEFQDFFNVVINGHETTLPSLSLATIVGEWGEPDEFIGRTFNLVSVGSEMRNYGVQEISFSSGHDFSLNLGIEGWGDIDPRFDYDFCTAMTNPEFFLWFCENLDKLLTAADLDTKGFQEIEV